MRCRALRFATLIVTVLALTTAVAQADTRRTAVVLHSVIDDYGTPWGPALAVTGRLDTRSERCAEQRLVRTRAPDGSWVARTDRGGEFSLEVGTWFTSGVHHRHVRAPEAIVRRGERRIRCKADRAELEVTAYPTETTLQFDDETNVFSGVTSSDNASCIQEGVVRFDARDLPLMQSIVGFAAADDEGRWAFLVFDEPEPGHYAAVTHQEWPIPRLLGPAVPQSGGSIEQAMCSAELSEVLELP